MTRLGLLLYHARLIQAMNGRIKTMNSGKV
jgi:hypothetical protein